MKKYVLACAALAFLNACTYQNAQGLHKDAYATDDIPEATMQRTVKNASLEEVDIETARRMVRHFKDKETNRNVGGYLQFDPAELQQLLNQPYVTDVKLVHAAYLDSDPDAHKRNVGTILICIKESAGATRYKYYTSSAICPPPDGSCNAEN
jgi:hypothetical protein